MPTCSLIGKLLPFSAEAFSIFFCSWCSTISWGCIRLWVLGPLFCMSLHDLFKSENLQSFFSSKFSHIVSLFSLSHALWSLFFLSNSWILSLSVPMLLFGTSVKFSKLVGDHGILINSFSYHLFLIDGVPAFHIWILITLILAISPFSWTLAILFVDVGSYFQWCLFFLNVWTFLTIVCTWIWNSCLPEYISAGSSFLQWLGWVRGMEVEGRNCKLVARLPSEKGTKPLQECKSSGVISLLQWPNCPSEFPRSGLLLLQIAMLRVYSGDKCMNQPTYFFLSFFLCSLDV